MGNRFSYKTRPTREILYRTVQPPKDKATMKKIYNITIKVGYTNALLLGIILYLLLR